MDCMRRAGGPGPGPWPVPRLREERYRENVPHTRHNRVYRWCWHRLWYWHRSRTGTGTTGPVLDRYRDRCRSAGAGVGCQRAGAVASFFSLAVRCRLKAQTSPQPFPTWLLGDLISHPTRVCACACRSPFAWCEHLGKKRAIDVTLLMQN
jgi:hypothetical protein